MTFDVPGVIPTEVGRLFLALSFYERQPTQWRDRGKAARHLAQRNARRSLTLRLFVFAFGLRGGRRPWRATFSHILKPTTSNHHRKQRSSFFP